VHPLPEPAGAAVGGAEATAGYGGANNGTKQEAPMHEVIDEPDIGRLVVTVDGRVAELIYRIVGKRLVIIHTEVPEELGGQGIAGELVRAAIERSRRDGLTVVPLCPFAREWMADHPEAVSDVSVDWKARD
jgi:predicted GNAT family acetyltransferase